MQFVPFSSSVNFLPPTSAISLYKRDLSASIVPCPCGILMTSVPEASFDAFQVFAALKNESVGEPLDNSEILFPSIVHSSTVCPGLLASGFCAFFISNPQCTEPKYDPAWFPEVASMA